ncbi:MAG: NAD(FAD)-dependent dehydrogenase [Thermoplasmata archaeon]|nr:MAG: NAD(FAD)-dependent dehydrogenase [Thermoplasmata archaeon]
MTNENIIIIGCGAGGGTAAQFARKTDRKKQVTIFEKGSYPQYSKCGLPYAISGIIPTPTHLIEFTEEWFLKAKINLHLKTTITSIDIKNKTITAKDENDEIIEKEYDSLIIATGSDPSLPPIKNITKNNVLIDGIFTIRTIDDAQKILDYIPNTRNVTIVGAGLIGLEMADCLSKKGKKVTVVEALPNILPMLDDDVSKTIEEMLLDHISLFTNFFATEIKTIKDHVSEIIIKNRDTNKEQSISTDLLIIAAGTKPEITLAKQIGCEIGETGGIKVNNRSETSIPDVYAVGDCTEYKEYITQKPLPIGLGSIAVRQGIAAGVNAAGGDYTLPKGALQTFTSDFFNIQIAAVGPSTSYLESFEMVSGKHNGSSLPEYFPGGKPIMMKTMVDVESGKILSAQAVGENAAQRINSYATAMLGNLTIDEFRKLETAYAPPVAPTLDVVTITADIAYMKQQRKKKK